MHLKKLFLFAFICMCVNILQAQENKQLTLAPFSGARTAINIGKINILSTISDSVFVGVIPSSNPNTRDNIVAPEGISSLLQTYVNTQYATSFTPSGTGLLWDINTFSIGTDSSDAGIVSYVKLGADISKNIDSGVYQPLSSFDTLIIIEGKSVDLGQEAAKAVNALFNYSITLVSPSQPNFLVKQLSAANGFSTQATYTKKEIAHNIQKSRNWKILSDTVYPRGVYITFQEFKNNAPSVNEFYTKVDATTKKVVLYQFSPADSTSKQISEAWGLSINNELYRYKDGELYPIEKNGDGFFLSKYLDYRKRKNQGFFWRRYIGENQGNDNPYDDSHIYRVPLTKNASVKVEAVKLDNESGDLSL